MTRVLAITPGDPDGIGPEVTRKALKLYGARQSASRDRTSFLIVGSPRSLRQIGKPIPGLETLPAPLKAPGKRFLPGFQAGWSIQTAVAAIQHGWADALVTGPIHKERLQRGGFRYQGHTDFLEDLAEVQGVTMCLTNPKLTVSLVTTHLPLSKVPAAITSPRIERCVFQTVEYLRKFRGIRRPSVAVCGLNPHAGESGVLGSEEIATLTPTLRRLKRRLGKSAILRGPLPSDTLFAVGRYDAVIAMYHDQGLIPVKLLDFPNTVNVTLGLPFVRTSVDHGTAFDIAGKNRADPSSMLSAIQLAEDMVKKSLK